MQTCLRAILATCVATAVVLASGCCNANPSQPSGVGPPQVPSAPNLATPVDAVRAYLDWTTFAYRMANSEVASQAVTPDWGVHDDSYIELMREQGKGIYQQLTAFKVRSQSREGTKAVVAAREEWGYRYFSLADKTYLTPAYTSSYDTTYTLVHDPKGWLVDNVEAKALTALK